MEKRKPLPVGFSPEERSTVDRAATISGLTTAAWVRQVALAAAGYAPDAASDVPRRGLLSKIGLV